MFNNKDALLTDLYQLTMSQAYFDEHMQHDVAVFELFVRRLPNNRNFFVSAGLQQAVDYLTNLQFSQEEITFLRQQQFFSESFLNFLKNFSFTGDVYAMPEGTVFFPYEPILQIIAPIIEAQIIESRLINILHLQTLIASKAARCVLTAPDKFLIDFGMRRAHGLEASLAMARATYLAGFSGTATVLAGKIYDIPLYGTMAHSYIEAHASEEDAFLQFAKAQPNNLVFLIDTYDTEKGAESVVKIAPQLQARGLIIKAVRLDSGDLGQHAIKVRKILDAANLTEVKIFCSGDLDENKLRVLMQNSYPIDGFGIGTKLATSYDVPSLDCVYKLQEYKGKPKRKLSENKATWPGRKQVYRFYNKLGNFDHDIVTCHSETITEGQPLLQPVMQAGKIVSAQPSLTNIRTYAKEQLDKLPLTLQSLDSSSVPYPVEISKPLQELAGQLEAEILAQK
jgi:nicotinate phosphoribosyltransferase